ALVSPPPTAVRLPGTPHVWRYEHPGWRSDPWHDAVPATPRGRRPAGTERCAPPGHSRCDAGHEAAPRRHGIRSGVNTVRPAFPHGGEFPLQSARMTKCCETRFPTADPCSPPEPHPVSPGTGKPPPRDRRGPDRLESFFTR